MASYKQIVLDIKDYISMETACIEHLLEKAHEKGLPVINGEALNIEKNTLKDIADIIKEGEK